MPNSEETHDLLRKLQGELEKSEVKLQEATRSSNLLAERYKISRRQSRILLGITVGLVILLAAAAVSFTIVINVANNQNDLAKCLNAWANASQSRSNTLNKLSTARTDAIVADLDALQTIAVDSTKRPPVNMERALADVNALVAAGKALEYANSQYLAALKTHPITAVAAKLNC